MTQAKFSIFMHACQNLVSSITQIGISQHLLQPLLAFHVRPPGTLLAPFRVVFEFLLLLERSWRAAHFHIHGCGPLLSLLSFLSVLLLVA